MHRVGSAFERPGTERGYARRVALRAVLSTWLLATVVPIQACGNSCPGDYWPPSYQITLLDDTSSVGICDATVRINGAAARILDDRTYYAEIPKIPEGPARLTAEHPDYPTVEQDLEKNYDVNECGKALSVAVTIRMEKP